MKGRFAGGSSVTIECHDCSKTGKNSTARITYPDGRTVTYSSLGTGSSMPDMYPTEIVDAHGNLIIIAYRQDAAGKPIPPLLEKITDTVGRVVLFHYDSANKLTAITAPDLAGGQRTHARFFYSPQEVDVQLVLTNGDVVPHHSTYVALSTIYFPGNHSAFVLADFQRHGMPREIQERRAVQVQTPALDAQGAILSLGSLSRSNQFEFHESGKLSTPPIYISRAERWSDPVSGQDRTAVTKFQTARVDTDRLITVTYPDGSSTVQGASELPGPGQGLVYAIQRRTAQGRALSTTMIEWEASPSGGVRQRMVLFMNAETGLQTSTVFRYGQNDQQIVEEIHYAYSRTGVDPPVLWRKEISYVDDARYTQRNILNLPKSVKYFEGNSAEPSIRTDYAYDEVPVASIPDVTNHLRSFDPIRAGSSRVCSRYSHVVDEGTPGGKPQRICVEYKDVSRYRPDVQGIRGNLTSIRRYSNAPQAGGLITTTLRYDSAGNLLTSFNQANSVTAYLYDASTQFSLPTRISSGSPDPSSTDRISSTFTYYLGAGLVQSLTNPDGRTATYEYTPGASGWRLSRLVRANGASYSRTYMDDTLRLEVGITQAVGGSTSHVTTDFDGKGRPRKTSQPGLGSIKHVHIVEYDNMDRLHRQSRPYVDGAAASWLTYRYDNAGRLAKMSADDGSGSSYFYNERTVPDSVLKGEAAETLRVEDAWGRSRWINYDEQHNIRAVVEPNPSGSGNVFDPGSLVTRYYFDPFGRLRTITQGKQTRIWNYDSLGRLVSQSLPERSRTLDLSGNYVGGNGIASDVFVYDDNSNLVSRTDARGVKTLYDYDNDPLGRLKAIRYVIGGVGGASSQVAPTPDVNFKYQPSGDVRRLQEAVTSGVAKKVFSYDLEGRLKGERLTLDTDPASPFDIGYDYDELGRLSNIHYPARYNGAANPARPLLHYTYSSEGYPLGVELDGALLAGSAQYRPDGNLTNLLIATATGGLSETYDFDPSTGVLIGQNITKSGQPLVQLAYDPRRTPGSGAGLPGVTGQITSVRDVLEPARSEQFQYDALGRLSRVTVGEFGDVLPGSRKQFRWQEYGYDRYGNRTSVKAFSPGRPVPVGHGSPTPIELGREYRDGLGDLAFDEKNNHITSPGFSYDEAGNLTGIDRGGGNWQKYVYDAAGRLARVTDSNGSLIEAYVYGEDRRPLAMSSDLHNWTYWIWSGDARLAQYRRTNGSGTIALVWSQNRFFFGQRLLATETPSRTGADRKFHHPGRLGTIAISTVVGGSLKTSRRGTLPFGTDHTALQYPEDSRRFTSYERSPISGLDQAVNRYYDSRLASFTQVDPLEIRASNLNVPQSLNMYSYVANDPVNNVDPSGLAENVDPCKNQADGTSIGSGFCVGGVLIGAGAEVLVVAPLGSLTGGLGLLPLGNMATGIQMGVSAFACLVLCMGAVDVHVGIYVPPATSTTNEGISFFFSLGGTPLEAEKQSDDPPRSNLPKSPSGLAAPLAVILRLSLQSRSVLRISATIQPQ